MDISRIEGDTGYRPSYDVAAGVGDYIAWLRDHAQ
jgi:nucleoside-diphosphate-sugar epimerase